MPQKTDNIWISLFLSISHFFITVWQVLFGLLTGKNMMNITYTNLHAILKEIPHSWANNPTGIGIGRGIIVSILYFFQKHAYFHKK